MTIIGPGAPGTTTVQGHGWRVFYIEQSTVVMDNLIISGGDFTASFPPESFEDLFPRGAGIYQNEGKLTLTNCEITGNGLVSAETGGGVGAFYSNVSISNTTIKDNLASFGGGLGGRNSNIDLADSFITSNESVCQGGGGVLHTSQGTVRSTEITQNSTRSYYWGLGGGLYFKSANNLEITGTLISENEAVAGGGLLVNESSVSVSESTISGNKANRYDPDKPYTTTAGGR